MTRQKRNARYRVLERRPVGPQPGVTSDQVIRLTGKAAQCLSTPLRRIGYRDPETRQFYVFLTNLFHLTAAEVAAIYKARWQIELFFKWVKQHLKLKSFLGTTANAVMTQVWVALCVYLLVAYVKFLLRPPGRLYEIFKRLQVTALEYRALGQVLAWEAKNGPKRAPKWRCGLSWTAARTAATMVAGGWAMGASTHGMVQCLLAVRHWQRRDLGAEPKRTLFARRLKPLFVGG